MSPKFLIAGLSSLTLISTVGGVTYFNNKVSLEKNDSSNPNSWNNQTSSQKSNSDASEQEKHLKDIIFDLETYKAEITSNQTLKTFLTNVINGDEITSTNWNAAIESIQNQKIKDFLKQLIPTTEKEFNTFKNILKEAFKTKNTELFHSGIKNFLNDLSGSKSHLKEFFNKTVELLIGETHETIKNHPLSKGTWMLVFPKDKTLSTSDFTSCLIKGVQHTTNCNFYDLNLTISKSNFSFSRIPEKYHSSELKQAFTPLNDTVHSYSTTQTQAWTNMRRSLTTRDDVTPENLINWYQEGHKFLSNNWNQILNKITTPANHNNDLTINHSINEILSNLTKLNNMSAIPTQKVSGTFSRDKAYLVHFPNLTPSITEGTDYASEFKNFYTRFTKINMQEKNEPHYIQSGLIVNNSKSIPAMPIHGALVKAIIKDIDRIKNGHFSWLLTLGVLWYVEGLKMTPHIEINKINLSSSSPAVSS